MSPTQTAARRRKLLSFSVQGLSGRDDLLLKSLVRVLDHRAHQQWQSVEEGGDLLVSGAPPQEATPGGRVVLRMGQPAGDGEFSLPMPLHPGTIETMFNRIGDYLLHGKAHVVGAGPPSSGDSGELFRLRRWPSPALVNSAARQSLAAMMSVRPQSLAVLHRQTGVPLAQCQQFILELRHADILHCSLPEPASGAARHGNLHEAVAFRVSAPPAPPAPAGLLARIRARFSLQPAR